MEGSKNGRTEAIREQKVKLLRSLPLRSYAKKQLVGEAEITKLIFGQNPKRRKGISCGEAAHVTNSARWGNKRSAFKTVLETRHV